MEIRTARLALRRFRDADRQAFAAMNADPRVMQHYLAPLNRHQSDAFVDRIEQNFAELGHSLWAIEVVGAAPLIGYVGLWPATFDAPFTPSVEVGWRLTPAAWGHGYATEAAIAAVDDGFTRAGLQEILSFTAAVNLRSRAVMQRIGLVRDAAGDFAHPLIPQGHRLRPHVLYRFPDPHRRRREAIERRRQPGTA